MPGLQQHTHTHTHTNESAYADPVLRPPSPASSVGTAYEPDQTSHSDSEFQLSHPAFARKVREKIALDRPRPEEVDADRDPLIMVDYSGSEGTHGRPVSGSVWVGSGSRSLEPEEEKRLYAQTMHNLRLEVAKLREDEMFDQILLRGSSAALEVQPSTDDIDALMRGMMGMGTGLASVNGHGAGGRGQPHMGLSKTAPPLNLPAANANVNSNVRSMPATTGPGIMIANGPWNNFGQPPESETEMERRDPSMDNMLSGTTTVGKRSTRKGSARKVL